MPLHKRPTLRAILIALFSFLDPEAEAAAQSAGRMLVDDVTNAGRDFGAIWVAPFKGSAKDYLIAGGVLAGSAALSPLDDNVDRWAVANRDRGVLDAIKPFRRGGDLYSLNKATPYVGGAYVIALVAKHRGVRDGIFGCAAAYGANTVIRHQVLYRVLGRNRPDTIRNRPEGYVPPGAAEGDQYEFTVPADGYGQHSFPGGHVATMATCASFLNHRFEMGIVEPVLVVAVAAMGVGRLADQGHWLSDQVVGTAFGYAVGREVARRQKRRLEREKNEARTGAAPNPGSVYVGSGREGTKLGWNITF